ncbi:MAG: hypothetical protein NDI94_06280 [Candidatus Woesearchaeota archaeon]|nr:hypothetical protein [Candidatus Woesearchaeota archaeon]
MQETKDSYHSHGINYRLLFLVIIFAFAAFCCYISKSTRFLFVHYYDYYASSVLAADGNIGHYLSLLPGNYLLMLRSAVFFMVFPRTESFFLFSSMALNIVLIFIGYELLSRAIGKSKAFFFSLFVIASYFFIELMFSSYIDLAYFLLCGIFFICLFLHYHEKMHPAAFSLIVFFLFAAKVTSYVFVLIFSFFYICMLLYDRHEKRQSYGYIAYVLLGFFIYILVFSAIMGRNALLDVSLGIGKDKTFLSTKLGMLDVFHFLDKYRSIMVSGLLYISLLYSAMMKRWRLISMFIACELFLIVFFLKQSYHIRYLLPVYPVYLMISFGFLWDISKHLVKIHRHVLLAGMIILSLILSVSAINLLREPIYTDTDKDIVQMSDYLGQHLIPGSRVYIGSGIPEDVYFHIGSSLIDSQHLNQGDMVIYHNLNWSGRFNYVLVNETRSADYVICLDCAGYGPSSDNVVFPGIYGHNISLMKMK